MHTTRPGGFTLVEMALVLMVLGIMAAAAAPYLSLGAQAYNASSEAIDTLGKLRNASERLTRELREINNSGGTYDTTVGANPLVFTKRDGETVRINVAAPVVTLSYDSIAGVTPVLIDDVSSLTFSYLQADGSNATVADNLAFIEFELSVDPAPSGNVYSQRTRVALRNQQ